MRVSGVCFELPDGRVMLDDVSVRVGDGQKVALVGANGSGGTTLLRNITDDPAAHEGAITRSMGVGIHCCARVCGCRRPARRSPA